MTYIKFNAVDDSEARLNLLEVFLDSDYDDVPIVGKTDKNYLVEGVAFIDGDNEIKFYHSLHEEFGDIVEWSFCENPSEAQVVGEIAHILDWFKTAKPEPTEKDKATQIGAHFEEVGEMAESLGADRQMMSLLSEDFYVSDDMYHNRQGEEIMYPENWKEQLLDSLCDQIVTAVGVAYMMGMDISGALAEVIRSNNSKFVDGKAVKNEHGKIMKGENYSPPNLKPFL